MRECLRAQSSPEGKHYTEGMRTLRCNPKQSNCMHLWGLICDPMACSPQGSSVHGIFQARILEWVAFSYSRESSQPEDRTCVSCISCTVRWVLLPLSHLDSA